ncbi:MAG: hypothetical protein ABIT71_22540 [Vicinamibacteraceae bacterium]
MTFARRLAWLAGVVLPLGETARRWHQLAEPRLFWAWFDDWLIGAFLLYGAWRAGRDAAAGQATLAAAWGFTLAIAVGSFVTGVFGDADPTGASRTVVVAIKAVMLALTVAALVSVLRWTPRAADRGQ